jgi:hypothetical protein
MSMSEGYAYNEKDNVDWGREESVEKGEKQSYDSGTQQKTHGMSILSVGPVEPLSSTVLVNLVRHQTEHDGVDAEEEEKDDRLDD